MRLSVARRGDVSVVRVEESKLTYPLLSSFFEAVRQVVDAGARKLVLDLDAVTCLDSPSIGCLMDVHRLLQRHGGALELAGLRPRVETMLRMCGVYRILDVHEQAVPAVVFPDPSPVVRRHIMPR